MATLVCSTGTGVSSYVVHASYSISPDPYPSGATVSTSGKTLANIVNNSTITIRANETTCQSGYTFPVEVYTSTNGSTWTYVDYLQSGTVTFAMGTGTKYVRVGPATGSAPKTYDLVCAAEQGVNGFYYLNNTTSGTATYTTRAIHSYTSSSGYIYLTSLNLASGYSHPVWAVTGSGTRLFQVTNADGTFADHYVSTSSTAGGTRYVYLRATERPQHTIKLHSNGGSWYGGQTILSYTVDDGDSFSFSGHDPTTPPSVAKRIAGWGVSASSTSIAYSTTATLTNVNRDYEFYAVWASRIVVTFNANGGVLPNGQETRTDEYWQGSTIHFSDAGYRATRDGFTLSGWKNGDVLYPVTGTFDISLSASALTFVAEWKQSITKFYWHGSDTSDNRYFQTGELISDAILATAWNRLQDAVYDLFVACGASGSYTKQTAMASGTIYAYQYNNTVAGLQAIKNKLGGTTRIPSTVTSMVTVIIPIQWNGETVSLASLKSALNHLIDRFNS